jgi:hypothetical protein
VINAESGEPLQGATITTTDESYHTLTDANGLFTLNRLPAGSYTIRISHVGYYTSPETVDLKNPGDTAAIDIALDVKVTTLKGMTVSPGRFSLMGTEPVAAQTLTRGQLQTLPQFGDDLYRAVKRLPGLGSNDFSARFTVRGGEHEEVLVTLDGMEIYEPFHLKDIDGGVVGVLDGSVIQSVDLMTGAYTSEYGDRLSGVFGLKSKQVTPGQRHLSLGLSFLNARAATEGTFSNGRGYWLASARRGYIDLVLKLANANDNIKPTYYDLYGKVQYQLNGKHILTANVLHAGDDLHYFGEDDDIGDTLRTSYANSYGWMTLYSSMNSAINATSTLSYGHVERERGGQLYFSYWQRPDHRVHERRGFDFAGLKSDWDFQVSDRLMFKFGADSRWMDADYDYLSQYFRYEYVSTDSGTVTRLAGIDTTQAALTPNGQRFGSHLAARFRLSEPLTAEIGGRYDHVSYTGDNLWSPRVNLVYQPEPGTALRAGWGRFYQSQRIDGILVGDGQTDFLPAERADHYMIGYEHQFETGVSLRIEGYLKRYRDLNPQPRNSFDPIVPFPEREDDRSIVFRRAAVAQGIEFYLKRDRGGKFSWWASYAYAKVEDSIDQILFLPENVYAYQDIVLPNPHDQRHTFYADLIYRPNAAWQFNLAMQYHSGWPFTDVYLASGTSGSGETVYWIQADRPWSARFSSYKRLDLRVNRHFRIGAGRLTVYGELINALNWENVRGYNNSLYASPSGAYLERDPELWFERMPSVGAYYEVSL